MATWNKHVSIGAPAMTGKGIGKAIKQAFLDDPKAIAILEDMQFPEIEWFVDNMFDRMIECGIAEQNATGVAAGLAAEGFVPVTYNFLFASMGRAYNQIRQSILVDRFNVKFLAREGIWGEVGRLPRHHRGLGQPAQPAEPGASSTRRTPWRPRRPPRP